MTWTEFKPLGSKVLVRLHKRRDQIGSIAIPEAFARQPESGEVIAVGPRAPSELQPGVTVVCGKFNGVSIPAPAHDLDGEFYVMESDHCRRGAKLPRIVHGQTHAPFLPDVYGMVEAEPGEDVTAAVSSDAPKRSGL